MVTLFRHLPGEMPRRRAVLSKVRVFSWWRQDCLRNVVAQNILLKGRTDLRDCSRIPATETIRV
jgi:hypothetical protein